MVGVLVGPPTVIDGLKGDLPACWLPVPRWAAGEATEREAGELKFGWGKVVGVEAEAGGLWVCEDGVDILKTR